MFVLKILPIHGIKQEKSKIHTRTLPVSHFGKKLAIRGSILLLKDLQKESRKRVNAFEKEDNNPEPDRPEPGIKEALEFSAQKLEIRELI
ncbi:MAG: hypothetical protein ACMUIA_07015 [bacterium]